MKKNIKVIFISIFMMFVNVNAETKNNSSQSIKMEKQILNNISAEYCECSAYFHIATEAIKRSGEDSLSQRYKNIAEELFISSLTIKELETSSEEMAKKVTGSRFEFFVKTMLDEIANDYGNIAILMNQHQTYCLDIYKDPQQHTERIRKQTAKKFLNKGN